MRRFIALAVLTVCAPIVATAQSADSVPRELALALLRTPGDGLRLLVGKTPDHFPVDATPGDSKLLGAAERELSTTVVFVSKLNPGDAIGSWENQLVARGWTRPHGFAPVQRNGLISSGEPNRAPVFCSNGRYASLNANVRFDGGSTLLVQYSDPSVQSTCTHRSNGVDQQIVAVQDTMPLPALLPPAASTVVVYSSRASVDSWEQFARVSGTQNETSVLRHYASELARAGFTPGAPASAEGTATQSFRRKLTDTGFELFVSMVVLANPFDTTSMTVQLTVYRRR